MWFLSYTLHVATVSAVSFQAGYEIIVQPALTKVSLALKPKVSLSRIKGYLKTTAQ